MKKVRKGKVTLYLEPGLPRKIRLSDEYPHTNTLSLNKGGSTFFLCGHLLRDKIRSTTTTGCETCQVPLCSSNLAKFVNLNESCEYRCHHISDLSTLSSPEKRKWAKNVTGAVVEAASFLLQMNRNSPFRRRRLRRRRR